MDLDLVERKRLQIGERRITGPEIIHGDTNAEVLEAAQERYRAREVIDQHAFGDFQLQPAGRQPCFQQNLVYKSRQIAMAKLHRRQINGDAQWSRPRRRLATSLALCYPA